MKRTPKVIKKQTEEWLDERWMIANMKDARPQDMSYYMGALKALEFVGYEWKRDADGKHTLFKQIGVMEMFTEEYFSKWFDVIPEHDAKILWDDGDRSFLVLSTEDGTDRYADCFESFEEIKETYPNVLFGLDKVETQ